jgi:hypothetical protein
MTSSPPPEGEAIGTCTTCGKPVSEASAINVGGKLQCSQCLAEGRVATADAMASVRAPQAATPQGAAPFPGTRMPITKTNTLAIISLVFGIVGMAGCVCCGGVGGIIVGVPTVIVGLIAWNQIKQNPGEKGKELAMIGIALGVIEILLGLIVALVAGAAFVSMWNLSNVTPTY